MGARVVYLEPFDESEPVGLAPDVDTTLAQLLAAQGVSLTPDRNHAAAVLSGEVIAAKTSGSPISAGSVGTFRSRISVRAKLTAASGTILWETTVHDSEDFLAASRDQGDLEALITEGSRRRAGVRLARQVAQALQAHLLVSHVQDQIDREDSQ